MKIAEHIAYRYQNLPISGGGYVTGFVYHQTTPGILYARTDIGGTYRFDPNTQTWHSLIDHVTGLNPAEAYPIALALDDRHPDWLYILCGEYGKDQGVFCISEDRGAHFTYKSIPTPVHGNLSGRGTGCRLVVDPQDSSMLYFASQLGGLWKTTDRGTSWRKLPLPEDYTTFVWISGDSQTIVAGTAGYTTRTSDSFRGHSLYVSYDAGIHFEKLPMPENFLIPDSKMNGLTASRYDYDGTYLYITMNVTGRWNFLTDLGYSCDTGDMIGGRVIRYFFRDGKIAGFDDITPDEDGQHTSGFLNYGFGGICSCKAKPGLLACSTFCKEKESPEVLYVSEDYGNTWRISLRGLQEGDISFRTSYMLPKYNGGVSLLHWLSDIKIDPFDPNTLWFNSGTGVFKTNVLLSEHPRYHDHCDGIEETVHLNVYAPVTGDVKVVDIVGDLGGFAFRDVDKPCDNSFDDENGNRYITCINADFSDTNSDLAIITARGNWKGKTKGGLIRTRDNFKTFQRIPMPFAIGGSIARQLHQIENPNVNPGWVAMSPDGKHIVWSIADNFRLPTSLVIASTDGGETFRQVQVFDLHGHIVTGGYLKVFSDRVDSRLFYGFGETGQCYISRDQGLTFHQKQPDIPLPKADFGYIDSADQTKIRGVAGETGLFYIALGRDGLWKYCYDPTWDRISCTRLTEDGDCCFAMGLGLGRDGGAYIGQPKAIYLCGILGGEYGFFRTLDEGRTYARLNTPEQMYGQIISIDGDKRTFGRFYLATGNRGLIYGEPI